MLLVCVALNCACAVTTFARTSVGEQIQPTTPLSDAVPVNRLPPTTRSSYDGLGVYSLIGDAPDTAGTIARLSRLHMSEPLPSMRITLEQVDTDAVDTATARIPTVSEVVFEPTTELKARLATALTTSNSAVRQLWRLEGNGGNGVVTRFSERHAVEINPSWLDFSMFDSMKLDVMNGPIRPGETEPQLWRSAVTVGMGAAWELHRGLALQAGYRFYENPMPADRTSGALLNATQHVLATGLGYRQGAHSLALTYGLDLMDAAEGASISSARYGNNLPSTAHLVSFVYAFSF
jgi:hypothetical protein